MKALMLLAAVLGWADGMAAQAANERLAMSFRDPSRPGTVKVSVAYSSIRVKGYAGKEVSVETERSKEPEESERGTGEGTQGLRRLNARGASITIEEENNVITVSAGTSGRRENLLLMVPLKTGLKLQTANGRQIAVEGVDGEMELSATNGDIVLTDVGGSIVAHSMNGRIMAKLKRVDEGKPMSFSAYNGRIDVTLPAALKANLKMQTRNGEVYSDFDVQMMPDAVVREEGEGKREGKRRLKYEAMSVGQINGGGPDYTFKSYNGSIYIRKGN